jgi:hypothetical protein
MRRFVWIVSAVVALGCASTVASATATAAPAPAVAGACAVSSQTIQITSLVFQPPAVPPGRTSQAIVSAVNCTAVSQQASAEWLGRFVGSAPGVPTGCPVIDPLLQPMNFPPHGRLTGTVGYLVPGSCTATGLVVTVEILQNGKVVTQRSAELTIVRPAQASS